MPVPAQAASARAAFGFTIAACLLGTPALAQTQPDSNRPFEILDNSFLVEEAFNQDAGVFQNIFSFTPRFGGGWEASFTQEWPVPGRRHQLSYTVPFSGIDGSTHTDDVLLNYRVQILNEGDRRPALAPRLSLVLPTARASDDQHDLGLQVNVPFSKQRGDWYLHWNVGVTWLPHARSPGADPLALGRRANLTSPMVAASAIWRVSPMLNVMLETLAESSEAVDEVGGTTRTTEVTVSPGLRRGWNIGDGKQIVVGLALPVKLVDGGTETSVLTYFSYELPFRSGGNTKSTTASGESIKASAPVSSPTGNPTNPKP